MAIEGPRSGSNNSRRSRLFRGGCPIRPLTDLDGGMTDTQSEASHAEVALHSVHLKVETPSRGATTGIPRGQPSGTARIGVGTNIDRGN